MSIEDLVNFFGFSHRHQSNSLTFARILGLTLASSQPVIRSCFFLSSLSSFAAIQLRIANP